MNDKSMGGAPDRCSRRRGFRTKLFLPLTLLLLGLFVGFLFSARQWQANHVTDGVRETIDRTQAALEAMLESDAHKLEAAIVVLQNDPGILTRWRERDRDGLLAVCRPLFERLERSHGITHFYVHGPDRTCFLRVHCPDRHGDLVGRHTLKTAAATGSLTWGIELGPIGLLTLRVVQPLLADGEVIGYLELGEEIEHLTTMVDSLIGVRSLILIDKTRVNREGWESAQRLMGRDPRWEWLDGYVASSSLSNDVAERMATDIEQAGIHADASPIATWKSGRGFRTAFVSLPDARGDPVALLAVDVDVTDDIEGLRTAVGQVVWLGGGGVLGVLMIFYLILGRYDRKLADAERELRVRHADEHARMERDRIAIEESEAKYRGIYEFTTDAVMLLDSRGFTDCNTATLRMFGFEDRAEFVQHHPGDLSPQCQPDGRDSKKAARKLMRRAMRDGSCRFEWEHCRTDGTTFLSEVLLCPMTIKGRPVLQAVVRNIEERRRAELAVEDSERRFRAIADTANDAIIMADADGRIRYWNRMATEMFLYAEDEILGHDVHETLAPVRFHDAAQAGLAGFADGGQGGAIGQTVDLMGIRKGGQEFPIEMSMASFMIEEQWHAVSIIRDVSERRDLEQSLLHVQKMESVGKLAAGIAHEINTPTQFVSDNTRFLEESFSDIWRLLDAHDRVADAARESGNSSEPLRELDTLREEVDVAFLKEEVPQAIRQSLEGLERTATIVRAMKEFSHPDTKEAAHVDLNRAIESTITVARSEWKYVAEVQTDLAPDLPNVLCHVGDINQVVLNLIVNAAHAIGEVLPDDGTARGTIEVTTRQVDTSAEIRIRDTGGGIPEEIQEKVFDPFFTTKTVGMGTGQGLSLAHRVVVEQHGGEITFETESGVGTTFVIRLPIAGADETREE